MHARTHARTHAAARYSSRAIHRLRLKIHLCVHERARGSPHEEEEDEEEGGGRGTAGRAEAWGGREGNGGNTAECRGGAGGSTPWVFFSPLVLSRGALSSSALSSLLDYNAATVAKLSTYAERDAGRGNARTRIRYRFDAIPDLDDLSLFFFFFFFSSIESADEVRSSPVAISSVASVANVMIMSTFSCAAFLQPGYDDAWSKAIAGWNPGIEY